MDACPSLKHLSCEMGPEEKVGCPQQRNVALSTYDECPVKFYGFIIICFILHKVIKKGQLVYKDFFEKQNRTICFSKLLITVNNSGKNK